MQANLWDRLLPSLDKQEVLVHCQMCKGSSARAAFQDSRTPVGYAHHQCCMLYTLLSFTRRDLGRLATATIVIVYILIRLL